MKKWWILKILKGVAFFTLFLLLFGWITMALWNELVPELFNGPYISFIQALGLLILSKIIFGFGGMGRGHRQGWSNRRMEWKKKLEAKMAAMTPEEREKFKEMYYYRCGKRYNGGSKETPSGGEASATI